MRTAPFIQLKAPLAANCESVNNSNNCSLPNHGSIGMASCLVTVSKSVTSRRLVINETFMPLPTPQGEQSDALYLPTNKNVVVLGSAGSGKTTLALLRAAFLANPKTPNNGRTLLVTFNLALVTYLEHLSHDSADFENVDVRNYHRFARGI